MELKKGRLANTDIKGYYLAHLEAENDLWMRQLFQSVLYFAISRIKKYSKNLNYQDIKQEALLGLWIAIKTFDCHKNFDFYRWAQWNISKFVRNFLNQNSIIFNSEAIKIEKTARDNPEEMALMNEIFSNQQLLNEKERRVIYQRFILEETLSEVGLDLSLSAESIRKIQNKAIVKLEEVFGK